MSIYGYCRVSTKAQIENNSLDQQEQEILSKYQNAVITREQYSGAKVDRPGFSELINKLEAGDLIVVTKLDRFCRSTEEGLKTINELRDKKVSIHILNMGLIEDNPIGDLIVTNLLAFAQFERAMIIERTQAGKAIAKLNPDFREGRPKVYKKKQIDHALGLLESHTYKEVSELTGMSKSTLIRAMREKRANKHI